MCLWGLVFFNSPDSLCLSSEESCSSPLIILMVSLWTRFNRSILRLIIPVQQKCTKGDEAVEPTAIFNIFCPPGYVYWTLEVLLNTDFKTVAGKEKRNTFLKQMNSGKNFFDGAKMCFKSI